MLSVLLTYLVHILVGKLTPEDLADRDAFMEKPIFEELHAFSLSLSKRISKGKSTGATNYAVMATDDPLPVVYFSRKKLEASSERSGEEDSPREAPSSHRDGLMHFLHVEDRQKNAFSAAFPQEAERRKTAREPARELPIDYGVLFTGIEYTFSEIESIRERIRMDNEKLDSFVEEVLENLSVTEREKSCFSQLLKFDKNEALRQEIDNTNLKMLMGFDRLLKEKHYDDAADRFIDTVRRVGLTSFLYQKENRLFYALQYLFYKYRQFDDEEIGILPFNIGKIGGSILFVTKRNKSRTTIHKVMDHLAKEGHLLSLEYASWRDGYSSDGVILEQYASKKIYSEYAQEGNVTFSDTAGTTYFGDYDAIMEEEKDCILLDTLRSRISIKGNRLTSKDIHSQNTTIDMLKILMENIGKEVPNSKLPVSTYSKNKNEILGKVILPIRKLSKEYFGKEIPLVCSGGITDYYLRLEKDDSIRIGIVKKIGNGAQ